jgi:hypothetical protein
VRGDQSKIDWPSWIIIGVIFGGFIIADFGVAYCSR